MKQLKYQILELQPKMLPAYLTVSVLHFCNLDNCVKQKKSINIKFVHTEKKPILSTFQTNEPLPQTNGPSLSYRIGRRWNKWLSNTLYLGLGRILRSTSIYYAARAASGLRHTTWRRAPHAANTPAAAAGARRGGGTRNAAHAASAIEQLLSLARGSLRRALPVGRQ